MALQLSVAVRNARLDSLETTIGTTPTLEIRTGAPPADCAAADSGTLLASMALPSPDWMANASGGTKAKTGTWSDPAADAAGTAAHFRIKAGATCHLQGTVTATAGGGDMTLDSVALAVGQTITISGFTLTDGNA
jgi:hypothetical protein